MSRPRGRLASAEPFLVEGAAVETVDGCVFTVKGSLHPPGHVVAYLRYVPDKGGERVRGGVRYRRVYSFAEQQAALEELGVDYHYDDPQLGVSVQAVPLSRVTLVHDPRGRLAELREAREAGPARERRGADPPGGYAGSRGEQADSLGDEAVALTEILRQAAGVPAETLGVTGSLLFGLHWRDSDLDIVVYGDDPCRRVHAALPALLVDEASGLARPGEAELATIHAAHRADTPLSAAEFARHQAVKVNEGQFRGRPYFVRFVKLPRELPERYGDPRSVGAGQAEIVARVVSAADAIFTPCRYVVTAASAAQGAVPPGLDEIVSFRGRFAEQAAEGQAVRARGTLERLLWRDGCESARLVVGGQAGDFLVSLPGDEAAGLSEDRGSGPSEDRAPC